MIQINTNKTSIDSTTSPLHSKVYLYNHAPDRYPSNISCRGVHREHIDKECQLILRSLCKLPNSCLNNRKQPSSFSKLWCWIQRKGIDNVRHFLSTLPDNITVLLTKCPFDTHRKDKHRKKVISDIITLKADNCIQERLPQAYSVKKVIQSLNEHNKEEIKDIRLNLSGKPLSEISTDIENAAIKLTLRECMHEKSEVELFEELLADPNSTLSKQFNTLKNMNYFGTTFDSTGGNHDTSRRKRDTLQQQLSALTNAANSYTVADASRVALGIVLGGYGLAAFHADWLN